MTKLFTQVSPVSNNKAENDLMSRIAVHPVDYVTPSDRVTPDPDNPGQSMARRAARACEPGEWVGWGRFL